MRGELIPNISLIMHICQSNITHTHDSRDDQTNMKEERTIAYHFELKYAQKCENQDCLQILIKNWS